MRPQLEEWHATCSYRIMKRKLETLKANGGLALMARCALASLVCPTFLCLVIAIWIEA